MKLLAFFRENTGLADPPSRSVSKILSKTHVTVFPFWTLSRPEQIQRPQQSQRIKPTRPRLWQKRSTNYCCAGHASFAELGTQQPVPREISVLVDSGELAFDISRSAAQPILFGGCRNRDPRKCLQNA